MPEAPLQTVEQIFLELEKRLDHLYKIPPGSTTVKDARRQRETLASMSTWGNPNPSMDRQLRSCFPELGQFDELKKDWDKRTRHPHLHYCSEKRMRDKLENLSCWIEEKIVKAEDRNAADEEMDEFKNLAASDSDVESPELERSENPPPYTRS